MPERKSNSRQPLVNRLFEFRTKITPEKEYLFGAIATATYAVALVNPSLLPDAAEGIFTFLKENIPAYNASLTLSTVLTTMITVDGAKRIAYERLPCIKAYVNCYLLEPLKERIKK